MNNDIIVGTWKQLRGRVKEAWGRLTDDDLDRIDGRMDQLAGALQEKYGYARDKAEEKVRQLFDDNCCETDRRHKPTGLVSVLLVGLLCAGMALGVGCSKTDAGLTTMVKAKLAVDSTVEAARIEVDTHDNVVTLTGSVDQQAQKDQALLLARETKGVRDVVDMISVRTAEGLGNAPDPPRTIGARIDDVGITMAVKGRLLDDPQVKGLEIDVDTREGVVYLTGSVRSVAEKDRAVMLARNTEHVRDVVTNIEIEIEKS